MATVGERIKELRKEKGLTQKQLGELSGLSTTQIGHYEQGFRKPKIDTMNKIARALGVSITALNTFDFEKISDDNLKKMDDETLQKTINEFNQYESVNHEIGEWITQLQDESFQKTVNKLDELGLKDIGLYLNRLEYHTSTLHIKSDYIEFTKIHLLQKDINSIDTTKPIYETRHFKLTIEELKTLQNELDNLVTFTMHMKEITKDPID